MKSRITTGIASVAAFMIKDCENLKGRLLVRIVIVLCFGSRKQGKRKI